SHLPGSSALVFTPADPQLRFPTLMSYDVQGRLVEQVLPDGAATETAYSVHVLDGVPTRTTRVRDANGIDRVGFRDRDERIVAVREQNTIEGQLEDLWTRYEYNDVDELTRVLDAKNNATLATYDSRGLMVELDSPDMGLTEWRYDLAGNLAAKQTARLRAQ